MNLDPDSSNEEAIKETTNEFLMAKGWSIDFDENQIIELTCNELVYLCDNVTNGYNKLKKKSVYLKSKILNLENIFLETKDNKTKNNMNYYEILENITLEHEIFKKDSLNLVNEKNKNEYEFFKNLRNVY